MQYFLGIDTSNYTTSMGVVDEKNKIIIDFREILKVKKGEKGLRQSEAFFQHCNNFPIMYSRLCKSIDVTKITAVAVSTQPRFKEGSYMPVFKAGEKFAKVVSDTLRIPLVECSHQEGHIYAGMATLDIEPPFLALHLSGGTTDLMYVKPSGNYRLDIEMLGTSTDLHCGQFVDRLGVAMGMDFPAGKNLDLLSQGIKDTGLVIPSSVRDGNASFSGPLTKALGFLKEGKHDKEVALAVFKCIGKTVEKMLKYAMDETGESKVLIVGGVAANSYIRSYIHRKIRGQVFFADVTLSPDNAIGVASMGKKELV
ncbi:O-sialoglycoprotein endopeptidase [Alkalicella caledoniensis]|uniref:N(6)-L-threonylcarbamoyladenine synthase n=1 Tax=Alkalicella caledoniensis TaxID=2731377 RepID=A0A7G9WBU4_ALKCA|nr:hypothetical protein [Alkalicella caledoniensis]QNO16156.1 O-sialoglycoprotein endopeptidase [Alkalicella caledoniensis]